MSFAGFQYLEDEKKAVTGIDLKGSPTSVSLHTTNSTPDPILNSPPHPCTLRRGWGEAGGSHSWFILRTLSSQCGHSMSVYWVYLLLELGWALGGMDELPGIIPTLEYLIVWRPE